MTGATATRAAAMITRSDNDAAWALYPKVGRDGLEPWIAAHYGVTGLGGPPTMPGIWGSTQLTAAGLVRLYAKLKADPTVWPWLSTHLHHYEQRTASTVSRTPSASPPPSRRPAVKNGWDTNRNPAHPTERDRQQHRLRRWRPVRRRRARRGSGSSLYYAGGEAVVTHQARADHGRDDGGIPAGVERASTTARVPSASTPKSSPAHPWWCSTPGHNGGNASHVAQINKLVDCGLRQATRRATPPAPRRTPGTPNTPSRGTSSKRVRSDPAGPRGARADDPQQRLRRRAVRRRPGARLESAKGVAVSVAIHADGAPSSRVTASTSTRTAGVPSGCVRGDRRQDHRARQGSARARCPRRPAWSPRPTSARNGYYYRTDLAGPEPDDHPDVVPRAGQHAQRPRRRRCSARRAGRQRIAAAVAAGILAYLKR